MSDRAEQDDGEHEHAQQVQVDVAGLHPPQQVDERCWCLTQARVAARYCGTVVI
jgi:hypothetical protein